MDSSIKTADAWKRALRQLPEYPQLQAEFEQILTKVIQESKQGLLHVYLEEFRTQFNLNRIQERRKNRREQKDIKENNDRYKWKNSNQPSIYDKPLSEIYYTNRKNKINTRTLFDEEKN